MKRFTINWDSVWYCLGCVAVAIWLIFLIRYAIDCHKGHDVFLSVRIIDKEYREAWDETTVTTRNVMAADGQTSLVPVIETTHHAAEYILHYSDIDGYHADYVGEGIYQRYTVGSLATLRKRIGESGCICSQTLQ